MSFRKIFGGLALAASLLFAPALASAQANKAPTTKIAPKRSGATQLQQRFNTRFVLRQRLHRERFSQNPLCFRILTETVVDGTHRR